MRDRSGTSSRTVDTLGARPLLLAVAVLAAISPPAWSAVETVAFAGTVSSSSFSEISVTTPFAGTYSVEDTTGDTNADGGIGEYATGEYTVFIDGVGSATFATSGSARVRNDQSVFGFGSLTDSFDVSAIETARALSFTNAIDFSVIEFAVTAFGGSPTAVSDDSLTGAVAASLAAWTDTHEVRLTIDAAGDGSCPPLATDCLVVLDITSLAPASRLTVVKSGSGSGTVVSSPPGIDCGATCEGDFAGTVELTATADAGSVLASFLGCDSVAANVCTVDVAADRTVEAVFDEAPAAESIPTASEWALGLLAALIALTAAAHLRALR